MENISRVFQKQKEKEHMKRLSFITQFKIEFLLPLNNCTKLLGEIPDMGQKFHGKKKGLSIKRLK